MQRESICASKLPGAGKAIVAIAYRFLIGVLHVMKEGGESEIPEIVVWFSETKSSGNGLQGRGLIDGLRPDA